MGVMCAVGWVISLGRGTDRARFCLCVIAFAGSSLSSGRVDREVRVERDGLRATRRTKGGGAAKAGFATLRARLCTGGGATGNRSELECQGSKSKAGNGP